MFPQSLSFKGYIETVPKLSSEVTCPKEVVQECSGHGRNRCQQC